MTWDPDRQRVVLFGGYACFAGAALGDTWEYDGVTWTERALSPAPPARLRGALSYDPLRHKLVLFGGLSSLVNGSAMNDTWELDSAGWHDVSAAAGMAPPARATQLAFDAARGNTLMFSGGANAMGTQLANETWTYDGVWTRRQGTNNPSNRIGAAMAYDPGRQLVLLYGGFNSGALATLSVFNGTRWEGQQLPDPSPAARYDAPGAYDAVESAVIVSGGRAPAPFAQVLALTVNGAASLPALPETRFGHGAAFDTARGTLVLFGGVGPDGGCNADTLEY